MGRHREKAESFIVKMGKLFGCPEIAEEVLDIFEPFVKDGEDPIEVAWSMFIELLDAYGILANAFESAWGTNLVFEQGIGMGLTEQDAEDISQKVAMSVWQQIYEYKPRLASWNTWVYAIARNQISNFLRDTAREKGCENIDNLEDELECEDDIDFDETGLAIEDTCKRWIGGYNKTMAKFAAAMLLIYYNWDWMEPHSAEMVGLTGLSKATCRRCWISFVREVKSWKRE